MSAEGEDQFPRHRGRRGYIVGQTRDRQCWKVRFAGFKHPITYHKDFIAELVPAFVDGTLLVMPAVDAAQGQHDPGAAMPG